MVFQRLLLGSSLGTLADFGALAIRKPREGVIGRFLGRRVRVGHEEKSFRCDENPFRREETPFRRDENPFRDREPPGTRDEMTVRHREVPGTRDEMTVRHREAPGTRDEMTVRHREAPGTGDEMTYRRRETLGTRDETAFKTRFWLQPSLSRVTGKNPRSRSFGVRKGGGALSFGVRSDGVASLHRSLPSSGS